MNHSPTNKEPLETLSLHGTTAQIIAELLIGEIPLVEDTDHAMTFVVDGNASYSEHALITLQRWLPNAIIHVTTGDDGQARVARTRLSDDALQIICAQWIRWQIKLLEQKQQQHTSAANLDDEREDLNRHPF